MHNINDLEHTDQSGVSQELKEGRGLTTNGSSTSTAFINPASDSNHRLQDIAMGPGFPRLSSTAELVCRKEKLSVHL